MVLTWLHYQYVRGTFSSLYIVTTNTKGDMNTKSHGGETLVVKIFSIIGFTFYPPPSSLHYTLLELHKYNTGVYRGSFLLPVKQKSTTPTLKKADPPPLHDQR